MEPRSAAILRITVGAQEPSIPPSTDWTDRITTREALRVPDRRKTAEWLRDVETALIAFCAAALTVMVVAHWRSAPAPTGRLMKSETIVIDATLREDTFAASAAAPRNHLAE